jgi:hypothetical protein
MHGFKSAGSAQRFVSVHAAVYSVFNVQRHLLSRATSTAFVLPLITPGTRALSRCGLKNAKNLCPAYPQATATVARQVSIATARKPRCVDAEVRRRWTLKVL